MLYTNGLEGNIFPLMKQIGYIAIGFWIVMALTNWFAKKNPDQEKQFSIVNILLNNGFHLTITWFLYTNIQDFLQNLQTPSIADGKDVEGMIQYYDYHTDVILMMFQSFVHYISYILLFGILLAMLEVYVALIKTEENPHKGLHRLQNFLKFAFIVFMTVSVLAFPLQQAKETEEMIKKWKEEYAVPYQKGLKQQEETIIDVRIPNFESDYKGDKDPKYESSQREEFQKENKNRLLIVFKDQKGKRQEVFVDKKIVKESNRQDSYVTYKKMPYELQQRMNWEVIQVGNYFAKKEIEKNTYTDASVYLTKDMLASLVLQTTPTK